MVDRRTLAHTRGLVAALVTALPLLTARTALAAFGAPTRVATVPGYAGPDQTAVYSSARSSAGTLIAAGSGALRSTDRGLTWSPIADLAGVEVKLVVAGPGTLDALWPDPVTRALMGRRSTDDGLTWGPPYSIPVTVTPEFASWTVTVAPDGVIAVLWVDSADTIQVVTAPDVASPWSAAQTLGVGLYPDLAWDAAGTLLACWNEQIGSPATAYQVVCRTSPDRGASFEPPVIVHTRAAAWLDITTKLSCASRGPASFILVHGDFPNSNLARSSLDGGRTWSAPVSVPGSDVWSLETASGWTWMTASTSRSWVSLVAARTTDGSSWTTVDSPSDSVTCIEPTSGPIHPAAPGEAVLVTGRGSWRTGDGGLTWDLPRRFAGPTTAPVQDVRAVRLPSGRWVALWSDGQGGIAPLRASVSDDDGASFQSTAVVSDRPRVPMVEELGYLAPHYEEHRAFEVTVTSAGEVLAAWLAADEIGCATLRVSRSPDGVAWAPSAVLGTVFQTEVSPTKRYQLPFSITDDGSGRVVCVWTDALGSIVAARSIDGGSGWSMPQVVFPPSQPFDPAVPTRVVASAAGSLVFLALDAGPTWGDVEAARSLDGGASWTTWLVENNPLGAFNGVLLSAGPRLVGAIHTNCDNRPGGWCEYSWVLESTDDGLSWVDLPPSSITAEGLRAGDATGNVYYVQWVSLNPQRLFRNPTSGPDVDLGLLPASTVVHDVILPAPGDLRLLWADWSTSAPPGVFFAGTAAAGLLRDDSIGALAPRPDIAALFPLAPYAATAFPGMTDTDTLVVGDGNRPLVLYALGGNTASTLLVSKRTGLLRLDW